MERKVLFLENGIGWGGAAICLKLIVAHLQRDKFIPVIVSSNKSTEYADYGKICEWYWIPSRYFNKYALKGYLRMEKQTSRIIVSLSDYLFNIAPHLFKLLKLTLKIKPDLIHLNNEPVCNLSGVLVAKWLKIPCISHVRGPVEWNSPITRWLYRQVDYFIAVSEWIKRDVLRIGIPAERVETLVDGRDLEEFRKEYEIHELRKEIGLKDGELAVGIVGRINPWKGHKIFINATALLEKELPNCRFYIVGGSAELFLDYEKRLKEYAGSLGLKRLVFTGQRPDVVRIMKVLDVVVHASEKPDPYPNVVLEAMACGKAVIATNIGGPPEMIEHQKTGILIPPSDPVILAEKIKSLLMDRDLRERLGAKAKEVAFSRYDIKTHTRRIEEIYERFLKDGGLSHHRG